MNKELGELDLIKVLKNLCVISAVIDGYDEKGRRVTLYPDKNDMVKIQAALKRDEAKKPIVDYAGEFMEVNQYYCPTCKEYLDNVEGDFKCCPRCGQALDWSDEE